MKYFEEDFQLIDTENIVSLKQKPTDTIEKMYHALILGIRDYFSENGFQKSNTWFVGRYRFGPDPGSGHRSIRKGKYTRTADAFQVFNQITVLTMPSHLLKIWKFSTT